MIRSSGFRSFASIASRRGCSSTNRLRNQALRCTVAANVNNILPGQPLRYYVGSNSSCGAFSTSANKTNEQPSYAPRPFSKLLAANRGEIATRILRAGTELGCSTVALYSHEDRFTQHRWLTRCDYIQLYFVHDSDLLLPISALGTKLTKRFSSHQTNHPLRHILI